eukprot:jgi/Ulvmu1/5875/UM251_0001.1
MPIGDTLSAATADKLVMALLAHVPRAEEEVAAAFWHCFCEAHLASKPFAMQEGAEYFCCPSIWSRGSGDGDDDDMAPLPGRCRPEQEQQQTAVNMRVQFDTTSKSGNTMVNVAPPVSKTPAKYPSERREFWVALDEGKKRDHVRNALGIALERAPGLNVFKHWRNWRRGAVSANTLVADELPEHLSGDACFEMVMQCDSDIINTDTRLQWGCGGMSANVAYNHMPVKMLAREDSRGTQLGSCSQFELEREAAKIARSDALIARPRKVKATLDRVHGQIGELLQDIKSHAMTLQMSAEDTNLLRSAGRLLKDDESSAVSEMTNKGKIPFRGFSEKEVEGGPSLLSTGRPAE